MFKQIIGAALGSKLAKNAPAVGGATGAAIATAVPFVLSRMSIPAMIVLGAGGYAAKRYFGKKDEEAESNKFVATTPEAPTGTVINPPSGMKATTTAPNGSALPPA